MVNEITNSTSSAVPEHIEIDPILDEMLKAGVLYGRSKSKTHPKMIPYVHATRNGMAILDVEKTPEMIKSAGAAIKAVCEKKGLVLFVGTTPPAKLAVKTLAEKTGYPYITVRWLGGILTNFKTLSKRLDYYEKLKSDKASGRLEKYTKKERLDFTKEIERLAHLFGGLEQLKRVPDLMVVAGVSDHMIAVKEAKKIRIPVVGILSSNVDPALVEYPIVANDRSASSIQWVMERLEQYVEEGKRSAVVSAPEKPESRKQDKK
ncbi:MAG: 30S ribosomal protein S2 [Patescibacteria group bacterium]